MWNVLQKVGINKNYLHFNLRYTSEFKCIGCKRGLRYWPKVWRKNEGTLCIRHVTYYYSTMDRTQEWTNDSFIVLILFFIRDKVGRLDSLYRKCFTWNSCKREEKTTQMSCELLSLKAGRLGLRWQSEKWTLEVLGWVNKDR